MLLKFYSNLLELSVNPGHDLLHFAQRHGGSNAGHDVFSLGVHQEIAVEDFFTGTRIAREADAGTGSVAGISEHHLDDVDGGAEEAGDLLDAAIGDRLLRHPGAEHGADSPPELVDRIVRKVLP